MSANDHHRRVDNPITQTEDDGTVYQQSSTQYHNSSTSDLAASHSLSLVAPHPPSQSSWTPSYPAYAHQQPPHPSLNFSYPLAPPSQCMPHPSMGQSVPHPRAFSYQSWPYPYPPDHPSQWHRSYQNLPQYIPQYMPPPHHTDQWHDPRSAWLLYQKALSQQSQATPGSSMSASASPPIPQSAQSLLHQPSSHYLGNSLVSGSSHSASHMPILSTTVTAMPTTPSQCTTNIAVNQPTLNVSEPTFNPAVNRTVRLHQWQVYSVPPKIPSDTSLAPDTPGAKRVCLSSQNISAAPSPSSIIRYSGSPSSGMVSISTVSSQQNSPFFSSPVTESDSEEQFSSQNPVPSVEQNTSFTLPRPTFNMVYERLIDISAEWFNFGLALGLSNDELKRIDCNNHKKCEFCLRETLATRNCKKSLTWREVIKALRKKIVGRNNLAEDIEKEYSEQLDLTFQFDNTTNSGIPPHISSSAADPPECVVRYASYLRERYKRMRVLPDTWPPPLVGQDHFTNLALIERRKQVHPPQAKSKHSIEYDYAYGNVDNIVERKQAIKLENLFDPISEEDSTPDQFIILMDGAPGVGKTTISRKICKDWANNELKVNFRLVILLPLRELLINSSDRSFLIADLLQADDPELKDQVVKYFQKTSGIGVLFIFDGFDELSAHKRTKHSLFLDIMKGNTLHNCSVLVTSRTYASGPLKEISRINRHVEVLGFNKQQINSCIKKNITEKDKAQLLLKMLKERLDIVSLCYIPLNCRIVLYVYQQQYTLPDTLTQLYKVFILYTIKHYADKISSVENVEVDEIKQANSYKSLPSVIVNHLNSLSKIAYEGMVEDKLVFEYSSIREAKCALSLGLLNMIDTLTNDGEKHYYQFLHFTIQEFLAARHLAQSLSREEKLTFVQSKIMEDRFRITLLFLSGLTGLEFLTEKHPFPMIDLNQRLTSRYKSVRSSRARFLLLAQLLYESRNSSCGWLLLCLESKKVDFSEYNFSQFECLVFTHFLALTPEDHVWDLINLDWPHTSDQRKLFLFKLHSKTNIPILASTVELIISCKAKEVVFESHIEALSSILESTTSLQKVKISFSLATEIPCSFWTNVLIGIANNSSIVEFEISSAIPIALGNGLSIIDQFCVINLNRPIKKFSLSLLELFKRSSITCTESSLSLHVITVENWSILNMFTDLDEVEIKANNTNCPLGLFQALQSLHITKLILSVGLSDECYSALSEFVCTSKTLEFLKIVGSLTIFGLNTLSTSLTRTSSLKELCIRNVGTEKLNWSSFFQAVQSNTSLKKLKCSYRYTTGAVRAVCDMIISNRELEELDLDYIVDEYDMFAEAVLKSVTLKQITIVCNYYTYSKQIKHFELAIQRLGGEKIENTSEFCSFNLGQVTIKIIDYDYYKDEHCGKVI